MSCLTSTQYRDHYCALTVGRCPKHVSLSSQWIGGIEKLMAEKKGEQAASSAPAMESSQPRRGLATSIYITAFL